MSATIHETNITDTARINDCLNQHLPLGFRLKVNQIISLDTTPSKFNIDGRGYGAVQDTVNDYSKKDANGNPEKNELPDTPALFTSVGAIKWKTLVRSAYDVNHDEITPKGEVYQFIADEYKNGKTPLAGDILKKIAKHMATHDMVCVGRRKETTEDGFKVVFFDFNWKDKPVTPSTRNRNNSSSNQ